MLVVSLNSSILSALPSDEDSEAILFKGTSNHNVQKQLKSPKSHIPFNIVYINNNNKIHILIYPSFKLTLKRNFYY